MPTHYHRRLVAGASGDVGQLIGVNLSPAVKSGLYSDASGYLYFEGPAGKANWKQTATGLTFAGTVPSTETTGSIITTGTTWVPHTAAGSCAIKVMASITAVTGDFNTLRLRAKALNATDVANTETACAVACANFSASVDSTVTKNYPNLYGVQGLAQPNAVVSTRSTSIICGVYSCIDRTGANAGRSWSMWIDDHSSVVKAAGGHYLLRMSQNAINGAAVDIDGAITIQASRLPYLLNVETNDGFLVTADGTSGKTAVQYLLVKTPAGDRRIILYG